MGVAARWAQWELRGHRTSVPGIAATVGSPNPIAVEIYVNSAWTDISSFVSFTDRISITRGRADESATTEPQKLKLVLFNRDGRFCDTNPYGPYYGQLGRNTPIRVSKVVGGSRFFRFAGEVVAWPQTFDITGADVRAPIEAAGIKRRLSQGNSPTRSSMYQTLSTLLFESDPANVDLTKLVPAGVVGYWPMEDQVNATSIAGGPIAGTGTVSPTASVSTGMKFASNSGFYCSAPIPDMGTGAFVMAVPPYTATGAIQARFLLQIPSGFGASINIFHIWTNGGAQRYTLHYGTVANSFGIAAFDANGNGLGDSGNIVFAGLIEGQPMRFSIELTQVGSDVHGKFGFIRQVDVTGPGFPGTETEYSYSGAVWTNITLGSCIRVESNQGGVLSGVNIGHVVVQKNQTDMFTWYVGDMVGSYFSEFPAGRISRLCWEQGISEVPGAVPETGLELEGMDAQTLDTLVNLIQACVDTDLGILYEPTDQLGIGYVPRWYLYNQAPSLALDVNQHHLSQPLAPIPDDQKTFNDVTVQRSGGSSYRTILTSGAMSTQAPPGGVGTYDTSYTISTYSDNRLPDQAGWRLHLGTVNEPRYPTVAVQLAHPSFAGNYALTAQALSLKIGARITIDNPPAPLPPDEISLLVQGYTETFDQFLHDIVFNCTPESPWRVGFYDDPVYAKYDTDGSTLHADAAAAATTLLVDTTNASSPLWIQTVNDTTPSSFPFDIVLGGEVCTVTAITGSSSPQTFTVTRAVNGVAKIQTAGTDVRLAHPTIYGM